MDSIPAFPIFAPVEEVEHSDLIKYRHFFEDISDYNYTSLVIWGHQNPFFVSKIGNNLIFKFNDYLTEELFYSFVGHEAVNESIMYIKAALLQEEGKIQFKLIPEKTAALVDKSKYNVLLDHDNVDHIFYLPDLVDYKQKKYRDKRKLVNNLYKNFSPNIKILDINRDSVQKEVISLFAKWKSDKWSSKQILYSDNEYKAFQKLLSSNKKGGLVTIGAYILGKLVGFMICEIVDEKFVIGHFCKCDVSVSSGLYAYIFSETAKYFVQRNILYFNAEQDLGLEGLRKFKKSYGSLTLPKYMFDV